MQSKGEFHRRHQRGPGLASWVRLLVLLVLVAFFVWQDSPLIVLAVVYVLTMINVCLHLRAWWTS